MKIPTCLVGALLLAGCNASPDKNPDEARQAAQVATSDNSLIFADAEADERPFTETAIVRAQVILDHVGFSPGVIDGKEGASYAAAMRGFQQAYDLEVTGKLDAATAQALQQWRQVPATRVIILPAGFAKGPFVPAFPKDAADQAKLPALGYRNLTEALARIHPDS